MTFIRTPIGLSNQHIFLDVDAIVFVEGGETNYTFTQVKSGLSGNQSNDILFWQKMFKLFVPRKKLKFKPVGGKPTLVEIATEIKNGKISNVYVAMDRDHDIISGKHIKSTGVFYTYGYGWENDVFIKPIMKELFFSMCPVSTDNIPFESEISKNISEFCRDIRWAVYADILLFSSSLPCFFPRDMRQNPPLNLLKFDSDGRPTVNRKKIHDLFLIAKNRTRNRVFFQKKIQYNSSVDCYCHFFSTYSFMLLSYMLRKYSNVPEIPIYYACSAAIDHFTQKINHPELSAYYTHYNNQFSILP